MREILQNVAPMMCCFSLVHGSAVTQLRGTAIAAQEPNSDAMASTIALMSQELKTTGAFDWLSLWIGVGVGAVVAACVVGGACFVIHRPKGKDSEADAEETTTEQAPGKEEAEPLLKQENLDQKATDYQQLMQVLCQKIAQEVGPKLAKGGAVRNVLDTRMSSFTDKAKNFLLNEMNCTAGAVLREMNAQEGMLLLDWNDAVEANFPPLSILIAGILSPTILNGMAAHHLLQLITVCLPVFILCAWAVVIDWNTVCAIPTIFAWLYTQCTLAFLLTMGHGMLLLKIYSGKSMLNAKTKEVQEGMHHSGKAGGFDAMRQEFIGNAIVLQEALLIENGIRKSLWNTIVGLSTSTWLLTTVWNLTLICGWTFIPGVVAFHPKAAEVAKGDFCGSRATVLCLRISMILAVLYFFLNIVTVVHWACNILIESPAFSKFVLGIARRIDAKGTGLPVMEMFVKAFILRGSSDTLIARLAVVHHQKSSLEKKKVDLEKELLAVSAQIDGCALEEDSLRSKSQDCADLAAQLHKLSAKSLDLEEWKKQGDTAIDVAELKAEEVKAATTEALQELWDKIQQTAEMVENSETAQMMVQKAHEGKAYAEQKANEVSDKLHDPEFQKQMQEYAQAAADQAQGLAATAQEQAAIAAAKLQDPEFQAQMKAMAMDATQQAEFLAKSAAEQAKILAEQAQDPEFQEKVKASLKESAEQASSAAKSAAAAPSL